MRNINVASWNIQNFSQRRFLQPAFTDSIKLLAENSAVSVIVAMEVTLGNGAEAVAATRDYLNTLYEDSNPWSCDVTGRNAPPRDRRADRYAVFYRTDHVDFGGGEWPAECDGGNDFQNSIFDGRNPVRFKFQNKGNQKAFNVMVYHAPNPSNQNGEEGVVVNIGRIAQINTGGVPTLFVGDLNLKQGNYEDAFQPLLEANWSGPVIDPGGDEAGTTLPGAGIASWDEVVNFANPYDNGASKDLPVAWAGRFNFPIVMAQIVDSIYDENRIRYISDGLWVYRKSTSDHIPIVLITDFGE